MQLVVRSSHACEFEQEDVRTLPTQLADTVEYLSKFARLVRVPGQLDLTQDALLHLLLAIVQTFIGLNDVEYRAAEGRLLVVAEPVQEHDEEAFLEARPETNSEPGWAL